MNFSEKVFAVCRTIPKGKVASYGQIALLCGNPKQARHVGYVLGHNQPPNGENIPAHRVVNSQGYLSGAGAFPTADTQKFLLESEGVSVTFINGSQRVDLREYNWTPSEKELCTLRSLFESGEHTNA